MQIDCDCSKIMQDAYTRIWLQEQVFETIPWLASLDLNPVENVWGLLKTKVDRRAPHNRDEIIESILQP